MNPFYPPWQYPPGPGPHPPGVVPPPPGPAPGIIHAEVIAGGPPGYTPQRGTDYWTAEDVARINADIDYKVAQAVGPATSKANSADQKATAAEQKATEAVATASLASEVANHAEEVAAGLANEVDALSQEVSNKMEFYKVVLDGNPLAFRHDGVAVNYAQLADKYRDDKYFLFAEYENVTFIPSLPPDDDPMHDENVLEFTATWKYDGTMHITTLKINELEQIKIEEFEAVGDVKVNGASVVQNGVANVPQYDDAEVKAMIATVDARLTDFINTLVNGDEVSY